MVEVKRIYLRFIGPSVRVTGYHGFISLHFYTDLLWYCDKLWPFQRVVIIRFVTMLHIKVSCPYFIPSVCPELNGLNAFLPLLVYIYI